jgi:lipid A 3-O-deacylase
MKIEQQNKIENLRRAMRPDVRGKYIHGRAVRINALVACFFLLTAFCARGWAQPLETARQLNPHLSEIWENGIGSGFKKDTFQTGFFLGIGFGSKVLGSSVVHDLSLASVNVGWIFADNLAQNKWYRGNWELTGELFSGAQFHPEIRYIVGITPLLRYNFVTGGRWVPFVNLGSGVSLTDIGRPDLGGTFQFVSQGGGGLHYFFRRDAALTVEHRWVHVSNAGIKEPNFGANTQMFMAGIAWFF